MEDGLVYPIYPGSVYIKWAYKKKMVRHNRLDQHWAFLLEEVRSVVGARSPRSYTCLGFT